MGDGRQQNDQTSVWARTALAGPRFASLRGAVRADAVVIGAGYTGLCCALDLAERGHKAVVLEARELGWGGSGRNAGQWLPGWAGRTPQSVADEFGAERGRALNRFNLAASQTLPGFVESLGIAAELDRSGILMVAHTPKRFAALRRAFEDWLELGGDVTLIGRGDVGGFLATSRYFGGLLFGDGGMINPLAYARGLARSARAAGARIFARSPAIWISRERDRWRVETPDGSVDADFLALCTNAYTGDLWPMLGRGFYRLRVAMIASEELAEGGRGFMPAGIPFADTRAPWPFGGRLTSDGRFVASVLPHSSRRALPAALARGFDARFRRVFPGRAPPRWSQSWCGDLCVVPNRVPRLYRLGPGAMAAMGYSGAGIALGTALGRELARCLVGDVAHDGPVPALHPHPAPFARTVPWLFRHAIAPVARMAERIF